MSDDDPDVPTDGEPDPDSENRENKECFVIAPIGSGDTETRNRTDDLMDYVIRPVVEEEFGLDVKIAHDIDKPGNITRQVMELLFEADLVIADLTEHNPNVMYELAVRHAVGEPVVTIAKEGTTPPFDIGPQRTKFYGLEFGGAEEFKETLRAAVAEALGEDHEPDNPIQQVREGFTLSKVLEGTIDSLASESEEGKELAGVLRQIVGRLDDVERKIEQSNDKPEYSRSEPEGRGRFTVTDLTEVLEPSPFETMEDTQELAWGLEQLPDVVEADAIENEEGLFVQIAHDAEIPRGAIIKAIQAMAADIRRENRG